MSTKTRFAALAGVAVLAACPGEFRFSDDAGAVGDGGTACPAAGCPFSLVCSAQGCVECSADGHCGGERPRCDTARGRCVECLSGGDCDAGSVCETRRTNRCVATCTTDAGCAVGPCRAVDVGTVCDACADERVCERTTATRRCDEERRACVRCAESEHCPVATPRCDRRSGSCVECTGARDCAAGAFCVAGVCRVP